MNTKIDKNVLSIIELQEENAGFYECYTSDRKSSLISLVVNKRPPESAEGSPEANRRIFFVEFDNFLRYKFFVS